MFMFFVFRTALFLDLFRYLVLGTTRCLYYKAKHKRFFLGMSKNAFVFRTALIDWEMSRFAFFWLELCLIWILRDVFVFRTLLPNTEYREYLCLVCFLLAGTMFDLNFTRFLSFELHYRVPSTENISVSFAFFWRELCLVWTKITK